SEQLNALVHICSVLSNYLESKENFATESVYDTIEYLAPDLEYTIQSCSWKQQRINCSKFISPILTSKGLCFTFNALSSHEIYNKEMAPGIIKHTNNHGNMSFWNLENGYNEEFIGNEYPMRVSHFGHESGLELTLSTRTSDRNPKCHSHSKGFQIFLTTPGDSLYNIIPFQIQPLADTLYAIEPRLSYSPKKLSKYQSKQRQCFFDSERLLRFFKSYTKANCLHECVANFTMRECGCVPFSMPRDKSTRICGASKINCYEKAVKKFRKNYGEQYHCNCLEACIDNSRVIRSSVCTFPGFHASRTRLAIFFEDEYIQTKTAVETYTMGDFLSICGGLLGLFLGVSALSVIELIYYVTLRLFWTIRYSRYENTDTPSEQTSHDGQTDKNKGKREVYH
ncbi:pickpocket protein 28-like, partial [Sitodiplosis mosellana]|uniref:pickpocket protein 28-like n=1 Tax=Sitodiplosis mosellana TaxID=263140 RepID=UPI0024441BED